jgi:hypothetical protein
LVGCATFCIACHVGFQVGWCIHRIAFVLLGPLEVQYVVQHVTAFCTNGATWIPKKRALKPLCESDYKCYCLHHPQVLSFGHVCHCYVLKSYVPICRICLRSSSDGNQSLRGRILKKLCIGNPTMPMAASANDTVSEYAPHPLLYSMHAAQSINYDEPCKPRNHLGHAAEYSIECLPEVHSSCSRGWVCGM